MQLEGKKGNFGAAYEYELGDTNRQEEVSVINIENGYHKPKYQKINKQIYFFIYIKIIL